MAHPSVIGKIILPITKIKLFFENLTNRSINTRLEYYQSILSMKFTYHNRTLHSSNINIYIKYIFLKNQMKKAFKKKNSDSIVQAAMAESKKGPPPVHLWNPPFCGDLDMRIARDGTWFYLGTPIGRAPLVKLFSSIIRKDGDDYFLVTPVEKVGIIVDDAPFLAVDFDVENKGLDQIINFHTHVGDMAIASKANPIRVVRDKDTGEPSPYILIRSNLEALIDRKSFYRLVELGSVQSFEGIDWFGIRSNGIFFPIIPAADLE